MNPASPAINGFDETRDRSDRPFYIVMWTIGGFYIFMIVAMLLADATVTTPSHLLAPFAVGADWRSA